MPCGEHQVTLQTRCVSAGRYTSSPQVTNPRSSEDRVMVDWTLYKLLQPKSTVVEDADSVFATRFEGIFADILANGDAWGEDHHTSLRNMLLQLNSLEKVHEIARSASPEARYGAMIALRSDLWFFNILNVSQVLEARVHPSSLYVPDFDHFGGLNDRLAFGGITAMSAYCKRLEKVLEYAAANNVHAERLLGYVVQGADLDVHYSSILFQRVRSHGYMQGIPEFSPKSEKQLKAWKGGQWLQQDDLAMWHISPQRQS